MDVNVISNFISEDIPVEIVQKDITFILMSISIWVVLPVGVFTDMNIDMKFISMSMTIWVVIPLGVFTGMNIDMKFMWPLSDVRMSLMILSREKWMYFDFEVMIMHLTITSQRPHMIITSQSDYCIMLGRVSHTGTGYLIKTSFYDILCLVVIIARN